MITNNSLSLFAGPICINPTTERESFVWGMFIGGFLLGVLSILFGLTALIVKLRHSFNPSRKRWAKRYAYSIAAFFLLMGFGWLIATGGPGDDYCRTAQSSIQGNLMLILAVLASLVTVVSFFGFMFSFIKKT